MTASDSMTVTQMFEELKKSMITQDNMEQTVTKAVNSAVSAVIKEHIEPLAAQQRNFEKKFDDMVKRLELLENERIASAPSQDERQSKRPRWAGPRPPQRRHFPEHATTNPTIERSIKLTGFKGVHLTPEEMVAVVTPLLAGADFERISSGRPRADEATIVFKSVDNRDAFRKSVIERPNPTYTDPNTHIASTLYWNLPETKEERHKKFVVRRLRDELPRAYTHLSFEVNQRSGRIYADKIPLATVYINSDGDAALRFVNSSVASLQVDPAAVEAMVRRAVAE